MTKILIGCDHRGVELRDRIVNWSRENGYDPVDMGPKTGEGSVDYPDFAIPVAERTSECTDGSEVGVLICAWGNGMAISANKVKGIRAGLCMNKLQAEYSRKHNNANLLVLSAEATGWGMVKEILDAFLKTGYEGDRHIPRLKKISEYEGC